MARTKVLAALPLVEHRVGSTDGPPTCGWPISLEVGYTNALTDSSPPRLKPWATRPAGRRPAKRRTLWETTEPSAAPAASTRMGYGWVVVALGLVGLLFGAGCVPTRGPAGPLSVWIVSGERTLTAESEPLLENEIYSAARGTVEMMAAVNETISFQLGLRTTKPPAGPFDIRITDLEGPGRKLAARVTASIYRVHHARVERFASWYPARTGRTTAPRSFPDILVPWGLRAAAGRCVSTRPAAKSSGSTCTSPPPPIPATIPADSNSTPQPMASPCLRATCGCAWSRW